MRLLLVEDEQFTRDGILSIIPWEELGIDQIETAQDGEEGYEKAVSFCPEIILTDVKMPRMDGVSMSFRVRDALPFCCIIFMSGYADKEYLKSAIQLSALNYIEKPFSPDELHSTLKIAVQKCKKHQEQLSSASEMARQLDLSLPMIKNKIALLLLQPRFHQTALEEYLHIVWPDFDAGGFWITFLIQLFQPETSSAPPSSIQDSICNLLESRITLSGFANVITGIKNDSIIVVHLNLKNRSGNSIPSSQIGNICYLLCDILKSVCRFLLATGRPVSRFEHIYDSYQTASICLQRGFFHKEDAVLFYEEDHNHLIYHFPEDAGAPFEKALKLHDKKAAATFINTLVEKLRHFDGTLVSTVKNFFIQLANTLYDISKLCGNHIFDGENPETIHEEIWEMAFLSQIEAYLMDKLDRFFHETDSGYSQYPLAFQVRMFLEENFENEDLSLTEISSYFSVSESYLCILFKKAFHTTVNQYLIDLRIQKAIYYLKNTNKKIKEISDLVGYRDSNYFIRIFKKNTGLTPADYRSSSFSE